MQIFVVTIFGLIILWGMEIRFRDLYGKLENYERRNTDFECRVNKLEDVLKVG